MEEELLKFLKDRGVPEDTIQLFIDNKIDCNVLPLMDDDTLKTYLPAYGDRVSAVAFCKAQKSVPVNLHAIGRNVTERLRMKLSNRATSSTVRCGNSNAQKKHRRIELGWMDFSDKFNSYKQVKSQSGGGVRHLSIEKELSLNEIQDVGKDIFFPSGRNQRGCVEDFNIELKDFQGAALDPKMTVQTAYEHAKLRMLRLYLYTKKKSEGKESCSPTGGTEDLDLPNICTDKTEDGDFEMVRPIVPGNRQQNPKCADEEEEVNSNTTGAEPSDYVESGTPTVLLKITSNMDREATQISQEQPPSNVSMASIQSASNHSNLQNHSLLPENHSSSSMKGNNSGSDDDFELLQPISLCKRRRRLNLSTSSISAATTNPETTSAEVMSLRDSTGTTGVTEITTNAASSCSSQPPTTAYMSVDDSDSTATLEDLNSGDVQAAIEASLSDCFSGESVQSVLGALNRQVSKDGPANIINVNREAVLNGARRGFSRKQFRDECRLNVRFSGEMAIDDGGPRREFMRLALSAIRDSPIFEGDTTSKTICPDLISEQKGDYNLFGRIIAYSIIHEGPSPAFFSLLMYNKIVGRPCVPQLSDVSDTELRMQLKMLNDVEDIRTVSISENLQQAVDYVGGMALLALNKKKELVDALLMHLVIDRIARVLQQFLDGLSCLGFLQAVRHNPHIMESLFIHKSVPLTAMQVEDIFEVVFSAEGSNNYTRELQTHCHWRDYLLDIEEQPDALETLLQFVTCLREPPVLGFNPPAKLNFTHPDPNDEYDGTPYANTCGNALSVPVLLSYETFVERMNLALTVGTVFTNS